MPSDVGARMADPEEVRRTVEHLLERAERSGGPAAPPGGDGDAAEESGGEASGGDPADLFEQAHEVLLEALSTVDRN